MQSQEAEVESDDETIGRFETPDDTTDVIFLIEERKLYFNKAILMMCSPVFKIMFTANFKEKEAKEIELPEKKYDHVVAFFEQMHPVYSHQTPVTETSFGQILPLADEYQVEHVLHKCSGYLESQIRPCNAPSLTTDQVLFYLWLCEKHRLRYREKLICLAAQKKAWELQKCRYYQLLPQTTAMEIMTTRCFGLDEFLHGDPPLEEQERNMLHRPIQHRILVKGIPSRRRACSDCKAGLNEHIKSITLVPKPATAVLPVPAKQELI